ncbi:nitroreductase family protein [Candidatus Cryosericum septentrionale]|jgi:F420 biosynthesis protein FbiB-like protein|uniref:Nitroreductase n=1 Tax=Candidatus Cryosericum septentrionale TaxID=2290913 RepID=A0A398DU62_9BACT|nr:nitroreductase family protein [Candidatus Cryosericum septentrionale]RIE15517.1 nitroreductase [Candidatus Cryosericum septentrionale]
METLEAIAARRSVRKFTDRPVAEETVNAVLAAAILAPSGKNRQPWRFVVVAGDEKRAQMVRVMREGIADTKARGMETGSAIMTARVMERAPVTIFVFNPEGVHPWASRSLAQTLMEAVDTQSIGAAIQNMLLAAQSMGLGTLWMCDVWSAYQQLEAWLGESVELVAAVALGYPDEQPAARPRRSLSEVVRWF